ncbi:MAG: hypothetical protein IKN82_04505 [Treponema sp.]|nr:hypothetical protein [Treponema sp.]
MMGLLIKFILLGIFNISFFTITKATCTVSMWISYGFIHFAFLMFFLSPLFIRNSNNSRHVAIESITLVTAIYFVATLFVGGYFLLNPLLVIFQYSIESFVTGIYLIFLIVTIVLNNNIASNEIESFTEKQFLSNIFVKAEFLKSKIKNDSTIELLKKLQEESRYSPTKSSLSVKEMENKILETLDEITAKVENMSNEDAVSKIANCRDLLKQRNLMLKKNL